MKTAGPNSLTVTDKSSSAVTGTLSGITVTAAAYQFLLTGIPTSATHGTQYSLTVTVVDAYGNIVTGYRGTIHLTSSDPNATLPADYTFTSGDAGVHVFKVTLNTKGTEWLSATDDANASLKGSETGIVVK